MAEWHETEPPIQETVELAEWQKTKTLLQETAEIENVYFQPPTGYMMRYPAIVFNRKPANKLFANDSIYFRKPCYEVTVIDTDPEGKIARKVEQLPYCSHDRHFKKDNLNHDTFTLYN